MDWRELLYRLWRGLCIFASLFSVGRMFGGLLDMLDRFDP